MKKVDDDTFERKCSRCKGTGIYEEPDFPYVYKYYCNDCNRTGTVKYSISEEIKDAENSIKLHEESIERARKYIKRLKSL